MTNTAPATAPATADATGETPAPPAAPTPELVAKYNIPGPRYTSYPTAVQFSENTPRDALLADATADFARAAEISLYVHIPFCETLCWYCACNTDTTSDHARSAAYLETLRRETALWRARTPRFPRIGQLHFGGGTPTFLNPDEIDHLGSTLHDAFDFAPDAEISVEIDPRRLTREHIAAYRRLGANRASFGVQDFDPGAQRAINRIQTLEMTAAALDWVRHAGYQSVNFDLIYGLPGQTEETFAHTLDAVVRLAPDRVAVFGYAHVPWIRPAQKIFERAGTLPTPSLRLALLDMAVRHLAAAGYEYVGMDHFALPDDELAAARREKRLQRNFQGYSTKAGLSILGLGATAISQTPDAFRQNEKTTAQWKARVDAGDLPLAKGVLLSDEDKRRREIIMRIMCDLELDYAALQAKLGVDIPVRYAAELARLAPLVDDGLVALEPARLRVTAAGRFFLRNIAMAFDEYLPTGTAPRHSKTV
jgi:oxygen-independent coproporphyrinogen-3 oxidase